MTDLVTTLQVITVIVYVTIIYKKYGVLTSISASSYKVGYWFYLWLGILATLNLMQGMEGFGFATSAGLLFTGITIDHNSTGAHENKVHFWGTVIAITGGFIGLIVLHGMWIPLVLFLISIALLYKNENFIWWIEIVAFTLILISYYLR